MKIVFAGPSLYGVPADDLAGLILRPPAECGDVARAVRDGATAIGLIDGRFETTASVWHKEILWAVSKGVRVLGSSSMGALRAAETWPFGMQGVGTVYRLYRLGALGDDDEVAILHGPPELGSIPLTEAMVNIRVTLRAARREGVISADAEVAIGGIAKSLFYKERAWERILKLSCERPELSEATAALRGDLARLRRDVKREDAVLLLSRLRRLPAGRNETPEIAFQATTFWTAFEAIHLGAEAR